MNWKLQVLPLESWIDSADVHPSGPWKDRAPLTDQRLASSPVEPDVQQWSWIAESPPDAGLEKLGHCVGHSEDPEDR